MRSINHYFIILAAYNEEYTLRSSFLAVRDAIEFYREKSGGKVEANVIICHNGCTDKTPEVAAAIKKEYSRKHIIIDVISSEKGMVVAQNACVQRIRGKTKWVKSPVIFIDADVLMKKDVIYIFFNQFNKHPKLKAVGAQPVPVPYRGWRPNKLIWDKVLNCRAYFPKSEIAVNAVQEFHPYADGDPQKIGADFEKRSKIYFHGRCFALRDNRLWDVPSNRIGEDTYLDRSIHNRFGPGSIRHMYDANVLFYPMTSIKDFLKTYYRIYEDIATLKQKYSQFQKVREFSKTKLDWRYIKALPVK